MENIRYNLIIFIFFKDSHVAQAIAELTRQPRQSSIRCLLNVVITAVWLHLFLRSEESSLNSPHWPLCLPPALFLLPPLVHFIPPIPRPKTGYHLTDLAKQVASGVTSPDDSPVAKKIEQTCGVGFVSPGQVGPISDDAVQCVEIMNS